MKTLIALILSTVCAGAQVAAIVAPGKSERSLNIIPRYHNHPQTPLLYEDFEANPGFDLFGWGISLIGGTVDPDYTSVVLQGSQSFFYAPPGDDSTFASNSFPAVGHLWMSFKLRVTANTSGTDSDVIRLEEPNGTCHLRVTLNNDGGTLKVWATCSDSSATTFGLANNTDYNLWVEYWNDNGGNSFASVGFSQGGTQPYSGDNFVSVTSTVMSGSPSVVYLGSKPNVSGVSFVMDHLIIDDAAIPDYP